MIGLKKIIPGLAELQAITLGDPAVRIAVLDGPIALQHPALRQAAIALHGTPSNSRGIALQHGTNVASLIFAQPGSEVEGIAPKCSGVSIPLFRDDGATLLHCSELDLARAVGYAAQSGAHIINISGGKLTLSTSAHPLLDNAIRTASDSGSVVVAAAGNEGCFCHHLPSALPQVLTVGAMDATEAPSHFSNWGKPYQSKGLLAPGENITVATPDGGNAVASGTSLATAIVSGILGLLLSALKQSGAPTSPAKVRDALLETAKGCDREDKAFCIRLLTGRLNLPRAMQRLGLIARTEGPDLQSSEERATPSGVTAIGTTIFHDNALASEALAGSKIEQVLASTTTGDHTMSESEVQPSILDSDTGALASSLPGNVRAESFYSVAKLPSRSDPTSSIAVRSEAGIVPAGGCGCQGGTRPLVYVLGHLDVDFPSRTRRENIQSQMQVGKYAHIPEHLLEHLTAKPWNSTAFEWVLERNEAPLYVIRPTGPFADTGFERLREFLNDQVQAEKNDQRVYVAIAGRISGDVVLSDKISIPVIEPEVDGMFDWTSGELLESVGAKRGQPDFVAIDNFLRRMTSAAVNVGIAPQDRAFNFAVTNLLNLIRSLTNVFKEGYLFDQVEVVRSELCHPESECYKVRSYFFPPDLTKPRHVIEYTVDVSGVIPVKIKDEVEYLAR